MAERPGVVVLASGSGTTFEAFGNALHDFDLGVDIRAVISDRPDAGIIQKAVAMNATYGWDMDIRTIDKNNYPPTDAEATSLAKWDLTDAQSSEMQRICLGVGTMVVSLQGCLSKIRGPLFETYGQQPYHKNVLECGMLNNHPGLTHRTAGLYGHKVHAKALQDYQADVEQDTAITIIAVNAVYDEGTTIDLSRVAILATDSIADVEGRVQSREKTRTPVVVSRFAHARQAFLNYALS